MSGALRSRTFLAVLAFALASILLMGCPPRVMREVLVYAEDDIDPVITLTMPGNRSAFDSTVLFVGTVTDSALTADDGQGRVDSLSYAVVDHESLNGDAEIADDGTFGFTIDMRSLRGDQTVVITAVDWSGNSTILNVELSDPGVGPDIAITSPAEGSYYQSLVAVTGVVNNRGDSVATSEVASLLFTVDGYRAGGEVVFSADDGSFSFSFSTISPDRMDESITIRVTATDLNGRSSVARLTLQDRSEGPALAVVSPAAYSKYQTQVAVTGTVTNRSDTSSTSEVGSLSYLVAGYATSGTVSFNAAGAFTFSFSTVSPAIMDGTITVIVTARDLNGRSTEVALSLLEDETGPYISMTPPLDGTNYSVEIILAGKVSDSYAAQSSFSDIGSLRYKAGPLPEEDLPYNPTTGVFSHSLSTTSLPAGPLLIIITARDLALHPTERRITMYDDVPPPDVAISTFPPSYSSVAWQTITVTGTVDTTNLKPGSAGLSYELACLGGTYTGTYTSLNPTTGDFTFALIRGPALPLNGNLTFKAIAVDNGLRRGETAVTVYNDTNPPVFLSRTLAADNSSIDVHFAEGVYGVPAGGGLDASDLALSFLPNGGSATAASITGVFQTDGVSTLNGGEQDVRVTLFLTGTPSGVETVSIHPADGTSVYDYSGNPMASGQATDPRNLYDQKAPDIPGTPDLATSDDTGISNTDNITKKTSPLTFSVSVSEGGTIELFRSGTISLGTATAAGPGTFNVTGITLPQGDHLITAEIRDVAGLLSPASAALWVRIDASPPAAPGTPDLAASDDTGVSSVDNVTYKSSALTFSISVAEGGSIELFRDGGVSLGTTSASGAGSFNVAGVSLPEAENHLTAVITDAAGNASPASTTPLTVRVDTTAPATPSAAPDLTDASDGGQSTTDNRTCIDNGLVFAVQVTEAGTIRLYSGSTLIGTGTALGAGTFDATTTVRLAAGMSDITAKLEDVAGNLSATASAPLSVTVDTTPPVVTDVDCLASSYVTGNVIQVEVSFDTDIYVVGTPTLLLKFVATQHDATYNAVASATRAIQLDYTVAVGDTSSDLDYFDQSSLSGTIRDVAGNDLVQPALATPGATGSISKDQNVTVTNP